MRFYIKYGQFDSKKYEADHDDTEERAEVENFKDRHWREDVQELDCTDQEPIASGSRKSIQKAFQS